MVRYRAGGRGVSAKYRRYGLSLAVAIVLALCGANIMDPYLCAVRAWAAPLILIGGIIGLIRSCRASPKSKLPVLLWLAVPMAVGFAWSNYALDRRAVLSASDTDIALLGRHFVVGYDSVGQVERLAIGPAQVGEHAD